MPRCVCGCMQRAVQRHHAIYEQHLRPLPSYSRRRKDSRNLVWVARACHEEHHSRAAPLGLAALPDSVFEFAVEVLGAGAAYEYLARRYAGSDMRHERIRILADNPGRDAHALGAGHGR